MWTTRYSQVRASFCPENICTCPKCPKRADHSPWGSRQGHSYFWHLMWMDVLNLIQSPQQAMDFKVSIEWDTGSFNSEICRFQQHKFTSMEKKLHTENHLKELKYIYRESKSAYFIEHEMQQGLGAKLVKQGGFLYSRKIRISPKQWKTDAVLAVWGLIKDKSNYPLFLPELCCIQEIRIYREKYIKKKKEY